MIPKVVANLAMLLQDSFSTAVVKRTIQAISNIYRVRPTTPHTVRYLYTFARIVYLVRWAALFGIFLQLPVPILSGSKYRTLSCINMFSYRHRLPGTLRHRVWYLSTCTRYAGLQCPAFGYIYRYRLPGTLGCGARYLSVFIRRYAGVYRVSSGSVRKSLERWVPRGNTCRPRVKNH